LLEHFMGTMRSPLLYLFLLAPVSYLAVLVGFPILYNLIMSVQDVTLGNIVDLVRPFVGLDNYAAALADQTFRKVFLNSVIFVSANMVVQVGLGLAVALFFSVGFPGAGFMRGLLLASWMLPALVVGALWKWIFATQYGLANFVLISLGIVRAPVHWCPIPPSPFCR
jgi:multiple sugar transport system permease protein